MICKCACVLAFLGMTIGGKSVDGIPKHRAEQIRKAAPAKARVKPAPGATGAYLEHACAPYE